MGKKKVSRLWENSATRFILVGCFNTLVGGLIMFGLYHFAGVGYWIASGTNYLLTSVLSFFLNKYVTFRNYERSWKQVLRFAINILVCYLLAYGIAKPLVLWVLSDMSVVVRENVAMLVGMVLFTTFNYVGQRFFAFSHP